MESIIRAKSLCFAKRIVKLYKYLSTEKNEYILSKQILRSGTGIGANVSEALCGISRKDFTAKMYIAFKESAETLYWLELLFSSEYITKNEYRSLYKDCNELKKMLTSITKSAKYN